MLVSIIIVNWNKKEDVCNAIKSVNAQDYTNKEIILVDNGSSDGSVELIKENFHSVKVISLDDNIGCPGGRNVGVRRAKGEILFFLDDDGLYKERELLSGAVDFFRSNPMAGAVYFKVINYFSRQPDAPLARTVEYCDSCFPSNSYRGGACAIRAEAFIQAGYYPKDFFRQVEEKFISLRLFDLGYQIFYFPKYTMLHRCSTYNSKSRIVARYQLQNELKTIIRLYPLKYMCTYIIAKMLTNLNTIVKTKAYGDYFKVILKIPFWLISIRKKNEVVTENTIKVCEGLKYFHISDYSNIDEVIEKYSIFSILKKRNKKVQFSDVPSMNQDNGGKNDTRW